MMSIKRMHAGDGYRYLLRTVVDAEHTAQGVGGASMMRYYAEAGTPPGRWLGNGLDGLNRGRGVAAGEVVTEEQMERLFKCGLDPVTGDKLARKAFEIPLSWQDRANRRIAALPADLSEQALAAQAAEIITSERGLNPFSRPTPLGGTASLTSRYSLRSSRPGRRATGESTNCRPSGTPRRWLAARSHRNSLPK